MASTQFEISETLGQLNDLAPAGYALGIHIEYTTPKFMFQTYPKDWLDYYSRNGLLMSDPMVAWAFDTEGATRWSALDDPAGVMTKAAEHGLRYGIVVSIVSDDSRTICGFANGEREFSDEEIASIQGLVTKIHDNTADTAQLDPKTVEQLKKMSIMVTHPRA
ncbi:LuxR family transcriptional regulator [Loktanella sp. PT4BL]|jgi:LuxR family transcriptional regulator|uniref:autoinducer binding domain-containing protein n=1 Tax=Rhodobacterales TaxID=204455 RepID=UPI000D76DB8B|nr:autoinducer binding domain-containing protein [Loktanella sp. PT4BL]PXW67797.1 LuxR family transcriptional regulator [Loktanella sp. PT4BL]